MKNLIKDPIIIFSFALLLLNLVFFLSGCAERIRIPSKTTGMSDIDKINAQISALIGTQQNLDDLINSEFSTCDESDGATVDALIQKICAVAQAATEESKAEMKAELALYSSLLAQQIELLSDDVASNSIAIDDINASLTTINATLVSIETDVDNLETAVSTLQSQIASITGVLNSNLVSISIGEENLSAGPLYEVMLKRYDSTRFNGYIEVVNTSTALNNNGLAVVNGNNTVTATTSAVHGLVAGDLIRMAGGTPSRGLTSLDIVGDFVIVTAPTTTTYTFVAKHNASSTGTLGGNVMSVAKISGRGLGTLWRSNDASDVAVRQTTLGSKVYNFIIRRKADITKGELCYSKSNNLATFITINASPEGGNGSVSCL